MDSLNATKPQLKRNTERLYIRALCKIDREIKVTGIFGATGSCVILKKLKPIAFFIIIRRILISTSIEIITY